MAVNYVKFYRGTPEAFKNAVKDKDTLYFITATDSDKGSLYLGEKLISGDISSITDLEGILLTNVKEGDLLIYNEENNAWINKSVIDAIGLMLGATEDSQGSNGLVPAPGIGQQDLFLRGDGTWAAPVTTTQLFVDEKTIEEDETHTLSLKDFGKQYYKYVAATGSEEQGNYIAAHYELQIVDAQHPWSEGLEPKVVEENDEFILGWFEPNPTTLDGVIDELTSLQRQINNVSEEADTNAGEIENLKLSVNNLTTSVNSKADANSVYTKTETDNKIKEAIANSQHLIRKTFDTKAEALEFAVSISNPDAYIYMVKSTNNSLEDKYIEYLYIDGYLEPVGSWDVDLDNYVTEAELALELMGKVNSEEGKTLISEAELEKLSGIEAGAQKNFISSVNENEFIVTDGKLDIKAIPVSKVTDLTDLLNNKADASTVNELNIKVTTVSGAVDTLNKSVDSLTTTVGKINSRVTSLEELLNSSDFISRSEFDDEMASIKESITWKDL